MSNFFLIALFHFLFFQVAHQISDEARVTYIVHLDSSLKPSSKSHEQWHKDFLNSLSNPVLNTDILYSYSKVIHGFSARLTQAQLLEIEMSPAHLVTHKESYGRLLTTHTPKFMGLNHKFGLWPAASEGEGVIVGLLDTGIWPESKSFNDEEMPLVPSKWRGKCQNDTALPFHCNNKLIGVQVFTKAQQARGGFNPHLDSPRDYFFHGTHTSSIAAGNYVEGASQFGFASGTAKGVAPRAHIAMYKVGNWDQAASDVLAAMDQAVSDGVDVLSLSIGLGIAPYFQDVIAIASLAAIERGVPVVCAAGNSGRPNTTVNAAPWITTVGAGTHDRTTFAGEMSLPDGSLFQGVSKFPISAYLTNISMYFGFEDPNKAICQLGSLNPSQVKGKLLLCGYKRGNSSSMELQVQEVERVKPVAAIILADPKFLFDADSNNTVPILFLPFSYGAQLTEYASRAPNATVRNMRFLLSKFGLMAAPSVAMYSSRGPNSIHQDILKPDLIAPGSDILAACTPFPKFIKGIGEYDLISDYISESGTSMATPHVAGVAALLKAARPEWSPAAIRSAMMTSAYNKDNTGSIIRDEATGLQATPLAYGAGHVDPNRALDPGMVYDLVFQDYVDFICGLGYNHVQMKAILRRSLWNCTKENLDINYPSFAATFKMGKRIQIFKRVVTNVSPNASTYRAIVESPSGMKITVKPRILKFSTTRETQEFVLNVKVVGKVAPVVHGILKWEDEHGHIVSSPVVALSS